LKNNLIEYLSYGKSERIAIIAVILLIVFLFLLPSMYSRFQKPSQVYDYSSFDKQIAEFLKNEETYANADPGGFDFTNPDKEIVKHKIAPFQFDPNSLDEAGWKKLGFTEKQATGILKYRDKGGRFRKKEDLKKLFVVNEEIYKLLEPFIEISETRVEPDQRTEAGDKPSYSFTNSTTRYQVELNSADSAELVKVYGIGPATARRILRYREKLGGFFSAEQLKEVAGIDSARFEMIKDGVFADGDVVNKIEINLLSVTELRQHPYIDYYIAKAIVDRRIKKGFYTSPDELREIPLIYEALFMKLSPYISINQNQ
jgi:competence ComEA-like helix-hairpin-helix protein